MKNDGLVRVAVVIVAFLLGIGAAVYSYSFYDDFLIAPLALLGALATGIIAGAFIRWAASEAIGTRV